MKRDVYYIRCNRCKRLIGGLSTGLSSIMPVSGKCEYFTGFCWSGDMKVEILCLSCYPTEESGAENETDN